MKYERPLPSRPFRFSGGSTWVDWVLAIGVGLVVVGIAFVVGHI